MDGDGGVRGRLLVLVVDAEEDWDPDRSLCIGRSCGLAPSVLALGDALKSNKFGEERDGVLLPCELGLPVRIDGVRWGGTTVDQKGDLFISATAGVFGDLSAIVGVGVRGGDPCGGRIRVGVGVTDRESDEVRDMDDGELERLDGDRDRVEGDLGLRYSHSVGRGG